MRNQTLARPELESLNWRKRKRLLTYAFDKVPIYRTKYAEAGVRPSDIRSAEDFEKLPVIRREDLRDHFADFLSMDARPRLLELSTTGGSTGMPVKVMLDRRIPLDAFRHRMFSWWGLDPAVNAASVARGEGKSLFENLLSQLISWPRREIFLDASSMTEADIRHFIGEFNQLKPAVLYGYVGAIHHLAVFAEENHMTVHPPKAVWVSSSPFSQSERVRIERVFSAPVYDQYGSREIPWIAGQCQERIGLHIFYDSRHVECVDEDNHSVSHEKLGRILLTDLENFLFPLIRYENGDRGRLLPDSCPCGISLPLMDKVSGRVSDMIFLPDKTSLAGEYLTTIFDRFPDVVRGFQLVQKNDLSLHVLYVPATRDKALAKALASVEQELAKRTRRQVPITFEAIAKIPHDRGKLKFVMRE
jgi:phenylacetate-CoA ligase